MLQQRRSAACLAVADGRALSFAPQSERVGRGADHEFGTGAGRNVGSLSTLAQNFSAFANLAGHAVINDEWQVDNNWVKGSYFTWSGSAPQIIINLAIGGDPNDNPNAATFPAIFSLDSLKVWVK